MFVAPPPPAMSADNVQVGTDYAGLSPVNDLSAYRDLLYAAPSIGAALDYANLPSDVRSAIWSAIDYAETNGQVAAVSRPADYPAQPFVDGEENDIVFTRAELLAAFAAKAAHALYHEVQETFPWRIRSYSPTNLLDLIGGNAMAFGFNSDLNWDAPGGPTTYAYQAHTIVDHDPNIAYGIAQPLVASSTNSISAVSNLIQWTRNLGHGFSGEDPRKAVDLVDQFDAQNYRGAGPYYASRFGCHSTNGIQVALARSINIPANYVSGWPPAIGHHSTEFRTADLVMQHCDDNYYYSGTAQLRPAKRSCFSYQYYVENVYTLAADSQAAYDLCWRLRRDREMESISNTYATIFTNSNQGWAVIRPLFDPYYVGEESKVDDFYYRLAAYTGNDGGGGPALPVPPPATGTISVDCGDFAQFATWTVSPDPGNGNDAGGGNASFEAPVNDYTLTWQDTFPYHYPPDPAAEGPVTLSSQGSITFGPPEYTPAF